LTNDRLPWLFTGYSEWTWRGHKINNVQLGDPSKPAILLIHGFGASVYHFIFATTFPPWRATILSLPLTCWDLAFWTDRWRMTMPNCGEIERLILFKTLLENQ
jgi:hypothetical protein